MNMNLISEISINGSPRIGYIYNQCNNSSFILNKISSFDF